MWKSICNLWTGKSETEHVVSSVNGRVISDAYQHVAREIDSLRQYDRGEKHIDAPDIKTAV